MLEEKPSIELECSSCLEVNTVKLSTDIKCKKCKETLVNRLYKSIIIPAGILLGIGAVSGVLVDDTLNFNRASVIVEYKMMKTCINEFYNRDRCACAVESMSGFLDANRARFSDKNDLKNILSERYNDCPTDN